MSEPTEISPEHAKSLQLFGDRLLGARTVRGLTQSELAAAADVSLRSIQVWERGNSNLPRGPLLRRLAEVLRVSIEHLLGLTTDNLALPSPPSSAPAPAPAAAVAPDRSWIEPVAVRLDFLDDITRNRLLTAFHLILDSVIRGEGVPNVGPRDSGTPPGPSGITNAVPAKTGETSAGGVPNPAGN
jgi:transcriptional regulator with XRE-family HTH domain